MWNNYYMQKDFGIVRQSFRIGNCMFCKILKYKIIWLMKTIDVYCVLMGINGMKYNINIDDP